MRARSRRPRGGGSRPRPSSVAVRRSAGSSSMRSRRERRRAGVAQGDQRLDRPPLPGLGLAARQEPDQRLEGGRVLLRRQLQRGRLAHRPVARRERTGAGALALGRRCRTRPPARRPPAAAGARGPPPAPAAAAHHAAAGDQQLGRLDRQVVRAGQHGLLEDRGPSFLPEAPPVSSSSPLTPRSVCPVASASAARAAGSIAELAGARRPAAGRPGSGRPAPARGPAGPARRYRSRRVGRVRRAREAPSAARVPIAPARPARPPSPARARARRTPRTPAPPTVPMNAAAPVRAQARGGVRLRGRDSAANRPREPPSAVPRRLLFLKPVTSSPAVGRRRPAGRRRSGRRR